MLTPIEDYENQLLLSTFSLASHALRLLDKNGLLDDQARTVIRSQLMLLSDKAAAVPGGDWVFEHLDVLVQILPPTQRGAG